MTADRYRIVDGYSSGHPPHLEVYKVVAKTPKGAWIVGEWTFRHYGAERLAAMAPHYLAIEHGGRFVLDGNGKRFAHETAELARQSYAIRKKRQIQHARNAIERAQAALVWLETGELPKPETFDFSIPESAFA